MKLVKWALVAALAVLAGCGGSDESAAGGSRVLINAAGASFPDPIYAKWFDEYGTLHPEVRINYQALGSGAGIRQLIAGTVDFGATDSPMSDEEMAQASTGILHFPTVLGAVVPVYNLPGLDDTLNFSADALAGIFLGTVTKWNDPALTAANPGVPLPDADIVVVHRSDGSGTTFVFTDFLTKANAAWRDTVGAGTAVNWPAGIGGARNAGVSGLVTQTPNSIGYVELVYALQNSISFGRVENASGIMTMADLASVTAAAASAEIPDDFRVSITNAAGEDAYPISSFTWLLIPETIADAAKRDVITDFLRWMLADGQTMTEDLGYAPLPEELRTRELARIDSIH